jgi:alkylation response protein AidB-like acyl-CoA dehydrogenase
MEEPVANDAAVEEERLVREAVASILAEHCPGEVVDAAEAGQWPADLWQALEQAEVTRACVPESLGGAGADLRIAAACVREAARHAAPVPLAETLAAGWLLGEGGIPCPSGPLATAAGEGLSLASDGTLSGSVRGVAFGRLAAHLVVLAENARGTSVALLEAGACAWRPGVNLAGEPRDDLSLTGAVPVATATIAGLGADSARLLGAGLRAVQIAGACASVLASTVDYVNTREQFGRPLGRFQAIQQAVAELAGEAGAAEAAAAAAAEILAERGPGDGETRLAVAAAKVRSGEAAARVAAIAHQAHGAMGFTREFALQRLTRRLWAWRDEHGDEQEWALVLGRAALARGADALWADVASPVG